MMEKLAYAFECGECTPTPFNYIYHHVQSCCVPYAPAERADTLPLFLLYPYMYHTLWCRQYELDLSTELDITCPIRVIHGLQDTEIDPAESLQVTTEKEALKSVLRIRDILVRIRIRASVPLTIGSGSGLFTSQKRSRTFYTKVLYIR
jgi:hypothetical protein